MRKHIISVLLALFCAMMTFSLSVTAAGTEAGEGNSKLTLHFYDKGQRRALYGANFYLYKVGDYVSGPVNATYVFNATKDFEDAHVDLNGLDFRTGIDNLTDIVNVLVPYTELNKETVRPTEEGQTDRKGDITFGELEPLEPGLYLVWGETLVVNEDDGNGGISEWTYIPQAFLIPLPYPVSGGSFDHDVEVDVKYERFPPPTAQDIDITVEKRWEPEGKSHPDSIIVVLLRNGTVVAEETLDADNDWTYTWTRLESNFRWEVAEKDVPDGYTVSVDRNGYYFTITNKSTETDDPPPPEDDPDPTPHPEDDPTPTPSDDATSYTTVPDNPSVLSDIPNDMDESRLPQTGQLWWPVPVLVAVGVPLLVIGAVLFVRKEESEEFDKPYE